ncbi:MAG: hypothetical protein QM627_03570 [Luteolibacter sp.]
MNPPSARNVTLGPRPDSIFRICLIYGIYFVSLLALIVAMWKLSTTFGVDLFSENSPLEWAQSGTMLLTAAIFAIGSRIVPRFRALMWLLTTPPLLACVREFDRDLDRLLGALGWQLPFIIILFGAAVFCFVKRKELSVQLIPFLSHRAFGLMFSGLTIAIPFAQMIGHGPFLKAVFKEHHLRDFTRLIEECGEMFGYWLILLAALDWVISARRNPDQIS